MAYSGATRLLRSLFHAHAEADARGQPVEKVIAEQREIAGARRALHLGELSRRDFVRRFGATAAGATAGAALATTASGLTTPKAARASNHNVAVVGAGLAGVRCAHFLANHGIGAKIYEASPFIGGRTFTDDWTIPGQTLEHGGAFISTEHNGLRNLVNNLGLKLEAVNGGALFDGEEIYLIDGEFYTFEEANADWRIAWKAFKQELQDAPWPQTFDAFTPRGQVLDNIPIAEWFDPTSPNSHPILADFGPDSNFAKLCYSTSVVEYGGDHQVQPALNLLYLLAWNPKGSVAPLAGTDEFYHVEGGSQRVVERMVEELPAGTIETEKPLVAITASDPNGPYQLTFEDGSVASADKLVLALPFRILRDVDISPVIWTALSEPKRAAIMNMPMGTNAKLHLELANRTWGPGQEQVIEGVERTLNGVCYTDVDDFLCIWDDSVAKPNDPVILLNYLGGTPGTMLGGNSAFGPANPGDVNMLLNRVDTVFPGSSGVFTGNAAKSSWFDSPWHKGAYSFWGIGGYTSYVGAAGTAELNLHFCGEHTSVEYQGFMEGAVESGERAGKEVFQSI